MTAPLELAGMKFSRLTVLHRVIRGHAYTEWLCRCDCGKAIEVRGPCLTRGTTRSCGCFRKEKMQKIGQDNKVHGHGLHGGSPTYRSWKAMLERCLKPSGKDWPRYGGRGISVHKPWQQTFEAFLADMGPQPKSQTLDRYDNDGDYNPNNCRWASRKEQANNRSSNISITRDGECLTVAEWSSRLGLDPHLVYRRLSRGWSAERALRLPRRMYVR